MTVCNECDPHIILWVVFAKYFCNVQICRCVGQGFWSKSFTTTSHEG